MLLTRLLLLLALLVPATAFAQRATTREALARVDEVLALRLEDGVLTKKDLVPAIVVSVAPAFEETRAWYPNAALTTLTRVFGSAGLRSCEACMAPRLNVVDGKLEQTTGSPETAEIARLDENARGTAPPARAAIWLEETSEGVSLRIIDLHNGRIVFAQNFDAALTETKRTAQHSTAAREIERRARGGSLAHVFLDLALYPSQHVSIDWSEQWGAYNNNLSGLTLSLFDPVVGIGASYFRIMPSAAGIAVGGKVLLSVPTAIATGVSGESVDVIDPMLTAVLMARVPIFSSNYAAILSLSTNGRLGIGISLMNVSLLPVLP